MKINLIFTASFLCLLFGCAPIDTVSDYDSSYNYNRLKTFTWHPGIKIDLGDARVYDDTAERRIKNAIKAELSEKGILEVNPGAEDMVLAFHVALGEPVQRDKLYESWAKDYGNYQLIYYERSAYQHPSFDVGTIILDVILPDTKEIIWRGTVQAEAHLDYNTGEQRKKQVNRAVRKLLKDFPPKT